MPIDLLQFTGGMDLDSTNENLPKGFVREVRNGIWRGLPPNMRFEMIPGTTLVPNSFLPDTGINVTIHAHYDPMGHRLFIFNYNSFGNHAIFIYYTLTAAFTLLIQSGINTQGDVLAFNNTTRIHSVNIIYGDGNDGDLLTFIDCLKRPRKLNINRLLAGEYTPIKDDFLKVIKAPPIGPPKCVYENDTTVTANNMINSLFNIGCGFIYDDFEKSVIGSAARQVLPPDPFDPTNNTDKSRCARLAIYVPTGDQNVKKIRIYGRQTKDGATSDWFVIDTLIKADLGISDNSIYRYLFFNNGNYILASEIYVNGDPAQGVLDFDYVPQEANTQSTLNGNVLSYGAITEGYDYLNPSFGIVTQNTAQPLYIANGTLLFAAMNGQFTSGQPQLTVYLTGVGTNDGFGNPITLEKAPTFSFVSVKSGITNVGFNYFNFSSHSIPIVLNGLQSAAVSAGWIFVSSTANSFTVYYPTGNVVLQSSRIQGYMNSSPYRSPVSALYPAAAYSFGVLYRDRDGRTNGVISNVTGNIKTQTQGALGEIPEILIWLAGFTPPLWAVYYEIVRTDNLTYQKYLGWVSNSAYSNTGALVNTQYAYLGLSNISDYNTAIKATEGVISYGFSSGDRVKILGRYDSAGTFIAMNYDYAVLGESINPLANGIVQVGSFLQIAYPTADVAADPNLKFDGSVDFQNYEILIYSYKAINTGNQNVYWQIGEQYGIGNPGTLSAYHMGNVGDNQVNLTDGDIFYRPRSVPIANRYYLPCGSYDQGTTYSTEHVRPGAGGVPLVDNGIWNIKGGANAAGGLTNVTLPLYTNTDWTVFNESGPAFNVRLQQEITAIDKIDPNGQFGVYIKIVEPGNVVTVYNVVPIKSGLQPGVSTTFSYDITMSLPPSGKLWIMTYAVNEFLVGPGVITLDIIRNRNIEVFDASFSDIYNLKTNSDNKPNVIETTAKRTFYSTKFRWGQVYQLDTSLNNSNRFYPLDFDEFDKSYGSIQRLYAWERELRIFQERRCGHTGIYAKFIKDNGGNNILVTVNDIISKNNIEYYAGNFGIGNLPTSLISSGFQNYLPDPVRGCWLRLSLDGLKNISEEFRIQIFAGANLPNYLNDYTYQFGGKSVIVGTYNFKKDMEGEVIFCLQAGTNGPKSILGNTLSFNEKNNAFQYFSDYVPDEIVCAENTLYSFYNGEMYAHNNTTQYANFYGINYSASIELLFNDQEPVRKTYLTMGYQSSGNKKWAAKLVGDIHTSYINQQTGLPQISQLIERDFGLQDGNVFGAFLRDANSMSNPALAINEGEYLVGNWIIVKLTAPDNGFNSLYAPFVKWKLNNKNF